MEGGSAGGSRGRSVPREGGPAKRAVRTTQTTPHHTNWIFTPRKSGPHTTHTTHTPHTPHTRIKPGVAFLFVVARMFAPLVGTMMNGEHAFATSGGTAWRRRQRRLRAFRRMFSGIPRWRLQLHSIIPPVCAHLRPLQRPSL